MTWFDRSKGLGTPVNKWWLTSTVFVAEVDLVYQPIGAANITDSYINLNNPGTNNASPVVAPTFATATGWTFSGTQHLTTNLTGTGNKSVIVRCNFSDGTRRSITGYDTGARAFYIERQSVGLGGDRWHTGYNAATGDDNVNFPPVGDKVACLARNKFYADGDLLATVGTLDTWNEGTITIANTIAAASRFSGEISAYAIYNRELTATEVDEITTNMLVLTSADDPSPSAGNVNSIAWKPKTKRLNSTSHELLAATDRGLFHTIDGGRFWTPITLPDPSNAEFSDTPAATIDELTFHWVDYAKTDDNTVLALAQKSSANRQWLYKSTDNLETWTSRGILTL